MATLQFSRRRVLAAAGVLPLIGAALGACAAAPSASTTASLASSATTATRSSVAAATSRAASSAIPLPATVPPAAGAITLTWGGEDTLANIKSQTAEVDAFNKQQSAIHVNYLPVTNILGAIPTKLQTMIAGGVAPDFFQLSSSYYASAVGKGVFLDLTAYVNQSTSFHTDDFFPVVWNAYLYHNRIFAIPREGAPTATFYNADMYQQAGIAPPPGTLKDAAAWTTDAFLEAATRLTRTAGGSTSVYGYAAPQGAWAPFLFSFGGDVLDSSLTKCVLDSPAAITAFTWLQDTLYKQQVAPQPAEAAKLAPDKRFEAAGLAMVLDKRFSGGEFGQTIHNFSWKLAPFPAGPAGRISDMTSNAVAVWAQTKHPAEAFQAADFMESTAGHLLRMQLAPQIGVPQRKSVVESSQFLNDEMPPTENQLIIDQIATSRFFPPMTPVWPDVSAAIGKAMTTLWQNKGTPHDVLTALVPQVNALLAGQGS